jgi:hypothetical protein
MLLLGVFKYTWKIGRIIEKTTSSQELFIQDPFASQFQDAFGDLQTPVQDFAYDFDAFAWCSSILEKSEESSRKRLHLRSYSYKIHLQVNFKMHLVISRHLFKSLHMILKKSLRKRLHLRSFSYKIHLHVNFRCIWWYPDTCLRQVRMLGKKTDAQCIFWPIFVRLLFSAKWSRSKSRSRKPTFSTIFGGTKLSLDANSEKKCKQNILFWIGGLSGRQ